MVGSEPDGEIRAICRYFCPRAPPSDCSCRGSGTRCRRARLGEPRDRVVRRRPLCGRAAREVAEPAGGEQRERHPAEHEQRNGNRGRARRVDVRRGLRVVGVARPARVVAGSPSGRIVVSRCRVSPARSELAAQRRLQRAGDDVLRVRVVAEVVGDRVDRLLVAVERVEAVDAPVVEPVPEHLLPALASRRSQVRRSRGRRRRSGRARRPL